MKKKELILLMIFIAIGGITIAIKEFSGNTLDDIVLSDNSLKMQDNIKIEIFQNPPTGIGWGYDIYIDNKLYVHQPNIPATNGNTGFKNKTDAQKIAEIVKRKIQHNILPPSVTVQELDSLNILK